jgi:hypothetical protein
MQTLRDLQEHLKVVSEKDAEIAALKEQREHEIEAKNNTIRRMQSENDALKNWRDSSLKVEASWDCQAVGEALGLTFGSNIRRRILPGINALKERVRDLEEANSQLAGAAIEKPPYKSDLQAENTLLREALEEIKQAFRASLPEKGVPDEDMEIFILYPMFRAVLPIINDALREAK